MKFEHQSVTLKDGRNCVLRPAYPEDSLAMIEYLVLTSGETPYLLRYPEEWNLTEEKEREMLQYFLDNERIVMMAAEVDGVIAGNCSINPLGGARKILHRCTLAIALKKEFWNLGIGRAMLEYLSELALKIGYEQIELEVIDGNTSAKTLYEKCGFVESGRHVRAIKYDDGTYRDEYIMCKQL